PAQALDAERNVACGGPLAMGEKRIHLAADHEPDDVIDGSVGDGAAADQVTITEDGVTVTNLHDLFQAMGDENDTEALRLEIADDAKELLDLARRQCRCWLIHHDQPRL